MNWYQSHFHVGIYSYMSSEDSDPGSYFEEYPLLSVCMPQSQFDIISQKHPRDINHIIEEISKWLGQTPPTKTRLRKANCGLNKFRQEVEKYHSLWGAHLRNSKLPVSELDIQESIRRSYYNQLKEKANNIEQKIKQVATSIDAQEAESLSESDFETPQDSPSQSLDNFEDTLQGNFELNLSIDEELVSNNTIMAGPYSGSNIAHFEANVKCIEKFISEVKDKIFVQNQLVRTYPWINSSQDLQKYDPSPEDDEIRIQTYKALESSRKLHSEKSVIDFTCSDEMKEVGQVCDLLMQCGSILVNRIECAESFVQLIDNLESLQDTFPGESLLLSMLTLNDMNKEDVKEIVTRGFKSFQDAKGSFQAMYKAFDKNCRMVAQKEIIKDISFLSSEGFLKYVKIKGMDVMKCIDEQTRVWTAYVHKVMDLGSAMPDLTRAPTLPEESFTGSETLVDRKNVWLKKLNQVEKLIDDINFSSLSESIAKMKKERVLRYLEDLSNDEANYDLDLTTTEGRRKVGIESALHKLVEKEEELRNNRLRSEEDHKISRHEAARTMPPIHIQRFKGPGDYIDWKDEHKRLNTHSDPFKRAKCVIQSIEDQTLLLRVKSLTDYDAIMAEAAKYVAADKTLIPSIINQLTSLKEIYSNADLPKLVGTIYKCCTKLKQLGYAGQMALSSAIINTLIHKFPREYKYSWERHLKDVKGGSSQNGRLLKIDIQSASQEEMINYEKAYREEFYSFIEDIDTAHFRVEAVSRLYDDKNKNKNPNQFRKVYAIQTQGGRPCLVCDISEPHKNLRGFQTSSLAACPEFRRKTKKEKMDTVSALKVCLMCLSPGHEEASCGITGGCFTCDRRHNKMICTEADTI